MRGSRAQASSLSERAEGPRRPAPNCTCPGSLLEPPSASVLARQVRPGPAFALEPGSRQGNCDGGETIRKSRPRLGTAKGRAQALAAGGTRRLEGLGLWLAPPSPRPQEAPRSSSSPTPGLGVLRPHPPTRGLRYFPV